jgi:hypothetical protein
MVPLDKSLSPMTNSVGTQICRMFFLHFLLVAFPPPDFIREDSLLAFSLTARVGYVRNISEANVEKDNCHTEPNEGFYRLLPDKFRATLAGFIRGHNEQLCRGSLLGIPQRDVGRAWGR